MPLGLDTIRGDNSHIAIAVLVHFQLQDQIRCLRRRRYIHGKYRAVDNRFDAGNMAGDTVR